MKNQTTKPAKSVAQSSAVQPVLAIQKRILLIREEKVLK